MRQVIVTFHDDGVCMDVGTCTLGDILFAAKALEVRATNDIMAGYKQASKPRKSKAKVNNIEANATPEGDVKDAK